MTMSSMDHGSSNGLSHSTAQRAGSSSDFCEYMADMNAYKHIRVLYGPKRATGAASAPA